MITVPHIFQNRKYSKHRRTSYYTGFQTQESNQTEPRDRALQKGNTSPAQGHLTTPRKSWKLMVDFFMALKTNIGSWIRNLERHDAFGINGGKNDSKDRLDFKPSDIRLHRNEHG